MTRLLAAIGLLLAAATPAVAQDKPFSMIGTWAVKGEGLTTGPSFHTEYSSSAGADAKIIKIDHRWVIDKQTGTTFSGTVVGPSGNKETIIGVLTADGKRGVTSNQRGGMNDLIIVNANTVDMCHKHNDTKHILLACTTATRMP
jgi:hypothetical protein